jgi:hypothetical protein
LRAHVAALNEDRRARTMPMTNEEKHMRIQAAHNANPTASDREIAREVGVDHKTVGAVRVAAVGNFPSAANDAPSTNQRILAELKANPARSDREIGGRQKRPNVTTTAKIDSECREHGTSDLNKATRPAVDSTVWHSFAENR